VRLLAALVMAVTVLSRVRYCTWCVDEPDETWAAAVFAYIVGAVKGQARECEERMIMLRVAGQTVVRTTGAIGQVWSHFRLRISRSRHR